MNYLHRAIKMAAASRPGSWLLGKALHRLDGALAWATRGRCSLTALLSGLPVVFLTTTGARSGHLRTVPVVAVTSGDEVVLIASNWGRRRHPSWYVNLKSFPEVVVSAGGRSGAYTAQEVLGVTREALWRSAVELYPGFESYARRTGGRQIPVIVLRRKPE